MRAYVFPLVIVLMGCDYETPEVECKSSSGMEAWLLAGASSHLNCADFDQAVKDTTAAIVTHLPWPHAKRWMEFVGSQRLYVYGDMDSRHPFGAKVGAWTVCANEMRSIVYVEEMGKAEHNPWLTRTGFPHEAIHVAQGCVDDEPRGEMDKVNPLPDHVSFCSGGGWKMLDELRGTSEFLAYCVRQD